MQGKKSFTTTEDDLVAANRLHARQLWNRRAVLRGWLLFSVATALIVFWLCERIGWSMLWAPLAATVYMIVGVFVSQLTFSRAARRNFRQAQSFWRPTAIEWDDLGVQFASDRGEVRDNWASYYSWAADDRSILLYQSAQMFIALPVRDLGEDAKLDIVSALKNAGVVERSSL